MVEEPACDQMHDLPVALDYALHAKQVCAEQLAALPLDEVAPYDHVDAARFILERDKYHTARGIGPLPAGHQPRSTRDTPVR